MTAATPELKRVTEGTASIFVPEGRQDVFYNKVQVVNRDLSIAVLSAFNELRKEEYQSSGKCLSDYPGLSIIEALSATGLRSMRYLHEIPDVSRIIVNDIDPAAVQTIRDNIAANTHLQRPERLEPTCLDANQCMAQYGRVDIVDLDPYGSANVFIAGALRAVRSGGLLCITCTDLAVLAGSRPSACAAKYGAVPHRGKYCHEMALRIVLAFASQEAARLGLIIEPLISAHIDFYVRIFVRVRKSQAKATNAVQHLAHVWQCTQCDYHHLIPLMRPTGKGDNLTSAVAPTSGTCPDCNSLLKMGGPWWSAPINNIQFLERVQGQIDNDKHVFASRSRLQALLTTLKEELPDVPLFYCLASMCHTLHCVMPRAISVRSALVNAGYRVSQSHTLPSSLKTDAPSHVIWDVLRCWVQDNPVKAGLSERTPSYMILSKQPTLKADFTIVPSLKRSGPKQARYLPNPEENWGPGSRAKSRPVNTQSIPSEQASKKSKFTTDDDMQV